MADNHKKQIARLSKEIDATVAASKKAGDYKKLLLLKRIIVRPGWTTPAEFLAVLEMTRALREQLRLASSLMDSIVQTAERVGK